MFKSFFSARRYLFWAWPGVVLIVSGIAAQVRIDVALNSGIGELFDVMQQSLSTPGSVELAAFESIVWALTKLVLLYVVLVVALGFYIKHWVFRWRQAMNDYYMSYWSALRTVEGASQRVQEDTKRFAATFELIGASVVEAVLTLFAFLPILWVISKNVHHIPFFGQVDHALVYAAVAYALAGTVILALVGIKLPGLEFDNQRAEAAYRKELVYAEDDSQRASIPVVTQLFSMLKKSYHRLFFHYLYFDAAKLTYLQFGIVVPFLVLGPTVIAGTLTLGMFAQTIRSFERIQTSFQVLIRNWASMVELMSVFKRLRAFEANINALSRPLS